MFAVSVGNCFKFKNIRFLVCPINKGFDEGRIFNERFAELPMSITLLMKVPTKGNKNCFGRTQDEQR